MEQKILTEFEAMRAEIAQRSSFQHAYFLLNIATSGTVMSFTLTKQLGDTLSRQALLVVPLISFSLFMLWFHQALVISHRGVYIKKKLLPDYWQAHRFNWFTPLGAKVMRWAFAFGQLGGFVGIPSASIMVCFSKYDITGWGDIILAALAIIALILNTVAFVVWFLDFYFHKEIIIREENGEQSAESGG